MRQRRTFRPPVHYSDGIIGGANAIDHMRHMQIDTEVHPIHYTPPHPARLFSRKGKKGMI